MKLLLSILVLFGVQRGFAEEILTLKEFLKSELSTSAKMSKEEFQISAEQKLELGKIVGDVPENSTTFFFGKTAEGKLEKACTSLGQKGKEGPMTVGVCFGANGLISSVKILAHEEERGKKITEEAFLKQFSGKKVSDAFVVGKDVNAISGATWSSKAVSEALRKASFLFNAHVGGKK